MTRAPQRRQRLQGLQRRPCLHRPGGRGGREAAASAGAHRASAGWRTQQPARTAPPCVPLPASQRGGNPPSLDPSRFTSAAPLPRAEPPQPCAPRCRPPRLPASLSQRGIDLPSLDPSYFTSLSYYILLLFGLRGVLTLLFRCGCARARGRGRGRSRAPAGLRRRGAAWRAAAVARPAGGPAADGDAALIPCPHTRLPLPPAQRARHQRRAADDGDAADADGRGRPHGRHGLRRREAVCGRAPGAGPGEPRSGACVRRLWAVVGGVCHAAARCTGCEVRGLGRAPGMLHTWLPTRPLLPPAAANACRRSTGGGWRAARRAPARC